MDAILQIIQVFFPITTNYSESFMQNSAPALMEQLLLLINIYLALTRET